MAAPSPPRRLTCVGSVDDRCRRLLRTGAGDLGVLLAGSFNDQYVVAANADDLLLDVASNDNTFG